MLATVTLRHPDGTLYDLHHGDIIGRLWSAALPLDDAGVSEAHAIVSLRGCRLKLLSLRGLFAIRDKPVRELILQVGQHIAITRTLTLEVTAVQIPSTVLALSGPGLPARPLDGVCSLLADPHLRLSPRAEPGALAVFWFTGEGWRVKSNGETTHLEEGWTLPTPRGPVTTVELALSQGGMHSTIAAGRLAGRLTIDCHYDTVHLHRDGQHLLTLSGKSAILISELASVPTSIAWDEVARVIWPGEVDRLSLRRRFDVLLARLRRKLRGVGARVDLVKPDGSGNFCLLLRPGDQLNDHS